MSQFFLIGLRTSCINIVFSIIKISKDSFHNTNKLDFELLTNPTTIIAHS